MIIGFAGHKGAGKDTAAEYLVKHLGYTRLAFADPLPNDVPAAKGISIENMRTRIKNAGISPVVIPDVQFADEAELVRELGGVLIEIVREDDNASDSHVSEGGEWGIPTGSIINNGTIKDLHDALATVMMFFLV